MQYQLKLNTGDRKKAIDRFKKLLDQEATIELKKVIGSRTLSQNSFLHLLMTLYAIEFGYTLSEAKETLKSECPFMSYKKTRPEDGKEVVFLKETSKLDVTECGEFIEWIYDYAGMNGCHLPSKDEYVKNKSEFQRIIRSCRNFL